MNHWLLKKGSEKKFRNGHPWVFSSELAQSPKGVVPGELVELRDFQGNFLARGYGHPNSMISFRALARSGNAKIDAEFFHQRFLQASQFRRIAGVFDYSHRLIFAEGDSIPGLVIDRFRLEPSGQVFVLQSSTAGIDRLLPQIFEAIEMLVASETHRDSHRESQHLATWATTSIVVANDSKSREKEGIEVQTKRVHKAASGFEPIGAKLRAEPSLPGLAPVIFETDFVGGQKTGFFLDQRSNIQLTSRYLFQLLNERLKERKDIKILDLCCYVGQWGAHLSNVVTSAGGQAHVTLVDASAKALELAAKNVERAGGQARVEKADVLDVMDRFEKGSYDVVICDPPAFIKKKQDIAAGTQAYYKLNREAIRKTAAGGLYITCSCSGLLTEEDFREMLARVTSTSSETRWLARGGHGPDHPQRPEFPQGSYLKAWIGTPV